MIRRIASQLGFPAAARLRKTAAVRILSAMCHVSKCDGIIAPAEVALISDTIQRLTGRSFAPAEIMQLADQTRKQLTPQDYAAFGTGLRKAEKAVMIHGVLAIAMASGRIFPAEYVFVTALAQGLGLQGADVRRLLGLAIADMNARGA